MWQLAYTQAVVALHVHDLTHSGCYADEETALRHDNRAVGIADNVVTIAERENRLEGDYKG